MKNLFLKLSLSVLSLTLLMGASKCEEDPKPPSLVGHWKISCNDDSVPTELMKNYVSNVVSFAENLTFKEFHSYGTYTKVTQDGIYAYKDAKLDLLNSQNQLLESFTVKKVSDKQLSLTNDVHNCELTTTTEPQVLTGRHPTWNNGALDLEIYIDGVPSFSQVSLRVSGTYESPQIFKQVVLSGEYEMGVATLHVSGTGENPGDYAIKVLLYKTGTVDPLKENAESLITLNENSTIQHVDGTTEILVQYTPIQK